MRSLEFDIVRADVGLAHFASLVLCDFVLSVLLAILPFSVGAASLRYVHLLREYDQ